MRLYLPYSGSTNKISYPNVPTSRPPYDVVVQDAHAPSRLGLASLLRAQPWVRRCAPAPDQAAALRLIREHRPQVAVVDVSTAGTFAVDLCEALRRPHPGLAIVATTRCARTPLQAAAVRDAGVVAWLDADASVGRIVATVRAAAEGERLPPARAAAGVSAGGAALEPADPGRGSAAAAASPSEALTDREAQVLRLLARGATNREIAAELHLGPDAIKKHASAVYRKLGVRNRTEAARRVTG
jgi:DNA-binding NarL/FixJ family response regulator